MPQDNPLLNAHQRRHFEVLIAGLEESLGAIEDLIARARHVRALHALLASIQGRLAAPRAGGER